MALFPDSMWDFPNVSAYDSDLREVLAMLRGLTHEMRDFKVINKITNAGAWDITKQYKPWTIVSDNNIGYISVRPVPAGIEITNTEYWALVADYDILITNLSERISALELDNAANKIKIANLETAVYKNVSFIGDSYLAGSQIAEDVAAALSLDCVKHAISAEGFVTAAAGKTFVDNIADFTADEQKAAEYLIVYGGLNDYNQSEADVYAAVTAFITAAKAAFVNATIIIIGPQSNIAFMTAASLKRVHNAIMKACVDAGVVYADARYWLRNVPYEMTAVYESDYTHPNALGKLIITSQILSLINGNGKINLMLPDLKVVNSGDSVRYTVCDDGIEFEFRGRNTTYSSNTNCWLFEAFNISPETVPLGRSECFTVYSMSDANIVSGILGVADLYRVANTYIRGLWIPASSYTGRIMVKGKIHFWDVDTNETI